MLALLLGFVLSALPPSLAAQTNSPSARVLGRVVEEATSSPVSRVRIVLTVQGNALLETLTDQDGRYMFVDLKPGAYRLNVQRVGYVTPDPNQLPGFSIAAGQALELSTLALRKTGVIAGRILDPFGEPLQDASVRAIRRDAGAPAPGRERTIDSLTQNIRTNDLGESRLFGLAPGEYLVVASPQSFGLSTAHISVPVLPITYYPGIADESAAQALMVGAGQTVNIEFGILNSSTFNVSGVVVDEGGTPVAGTRVTLRADIRGGGGFAGTVTQAESDPAGNFVIRQVPAGSYYAAGAGFDPVEVQVNDRDVEGLTIVVRR
jgi:protocatechuate 3,4-dioxygenase beta subunit